MFLVIIYIRLFIIPMFNSFFLIPFNMGFKLTIFYNFFFFNQNLHSILFYLQIVYGVGFYNRYLCRLEKVANIYGVKKMSKHLWFIGQWKRAMFNAFVANYLRNLCVAFLSIQTLFTRTANFSSTQLNRIRKTNRTSFFGCCWRLCRDFFFQGGGAKYMIVYFVPIHLNSVRAGQVEQRSLCVATNRNHWKNEAWNWKKVHKLCNGCMIVANTAIYLLMSDSPRRNRIKMWRKKNSKILFFYIKFSYIQFRPFKRICKKMFFQKCLFDFCLFAFVLTFKIIVLSFLY